MRASTPLIAIPIACLCLLASCEKKEQADAAPASGLPSVDDLASSAKKAVDGTIDAAAGAAKEMVANAAGAAAWTTGMCYKCHGDDGMGGKRAPDLTDDEWLHCDGSVAGIRQVIVTGVSEDRLKDPSRPFAMNPATKLVKSDAAIDALAQYVWSLSNGR